MLIPPQLNYIISVMPAKTGMGQYGITLKDDHDKVHWVRVTFQVKT